jgi:hypothetical protein
LFWSPNIHPEDGPFEAVVKRGDFTDPARGDRVVPYKIYWPAIKNAPDQKLPGAPFPLIIWSHGLGGSRDGAGFLSRYLTSYGYIVLHLTHKGTDTSLWEGKGGGHAWDIIRATPISRETTLERFMDVPFALASMMDWCARDPAMAALVDTTRVGISGHSFGAMTAQVMAGQMFPNEDHVLTSYREKRFKAGIFYSPVPIRHLTGETPEPHIYGPIDIPVLHMTGTKDSSPIEGYDYQRRLIVHDFTGHPEKYMLVKNDGDHMVYNGSRGQLEPNPHRETHEEIIKIFSLAFWDAQLKSHSSAKDWLTGQGDVWLGRKGRFRAS